MRYADNKPCNECEKCIEREEARRCNKCEGKTLQIFIRWMATAFVLISVLFALALKAKAEDVAVTSNVSTVKAWIREQLTFDDDTGMFSRTNFPSLTNAESAHQVATNLPVVLAEATAAMTNNIAPLKARLDAQRERPVATIFMTAGPNAALDRQNLTFVALSNEVKRVSDGLDIHQWVFSSSILRSDPIMECDITTPGGTAYGGEFVWDAYGTNAVTIVDHGEEYECYKMTCHIKTSATNLNVYVNPWTHIARRGQMFNFGNRKMRINRVYACTTNNLLWCGRFTTTNQVAIPYVPYADKGRFFWTEKEDQ